MQQHIFRAVDKFIPHRPGLLNGVFHFVSNCVDGNKIWNNLTGVADLGTKIKGVRMNYIIAIAINTSQVLTKLPSFDKLFGEVSQVVARLADGNDMLALLPQRIGQLEVCNSRA